MNLTKALKAPALLVVKFWDQFWFQPVDLIVICFMRLGLGLTWFVLYSLRHINISDYFYDSGFLPFARVEDVWPGYLSERWDLYFTSDQSIFWGHIAFLFLIFLFTLGLGGRWVALAMALLHISFLQRNATIVYGVDIYSVFWMLCFCLIKSDQYFSIKNLFCPAKKEGAVSQIFSSVGVRFFQITLVVSYVFAGLEKMKGATWWSGTALWNALVNYQIAHMDWSFLRSFPLVIAAMTYLTLIYEIYAPIGFFHPKTRKLFICAGLLFHVGIALSIGIYFFALMMSFAILIFLPPKSFRNFCIKFPFLLHHSGQIEAE